MTDDRLYLADIAERIQRIESYTQGGRDTFLQFTASKFLDRARTALEDKFVFSENLCEVG